MIHRPIDSISADDVRALLENGVTEGRTIDYKRDLPENTDVAKKDFLADLSSFANAAGGDLIFGVEEKDGCPTDIRGLAEFNVDKDVLRLDSVARDGIAPRIPGIRMQAVSGFEDGPVLIIRVPKSWSAPHMVTFKNTSRFYSRSSAGKFQLDVTEIRSAFAMSEQLPERIRRWRDERLGRILAGEGPVILDGPSALILHLIPFDSFGNENRFAAKDLNEASAKFRLLGGHGWDHRINVDGVLNYNTARASRNALGYCQVFRSGRIEAVDAHVIRDDNGRSLLSGTACEKDIVQGVKAYLDGLTSLGVPPPFVLFATVFGAKGAFIHASWPDEYGPIDRDPLMLPDVLIESHDCDVSTVVRPILDAIWNSSGFLGSPNYDPDGSWTPRH